MSSRSSASYTVENKGHSYARPSTSSTYASSNQIGYSSSPRSGSKYGKKPEVVITYGGQSSDTVTSSQAQNSGYWK